jgi:tetratricopeptide (TPR) repeat protein
LKLELRQVTAQLVEDFPNVPTAIDVRARVEWELGNSAEAVKLWERCVSLDPGFGAACGGIASVAADKGDFETAVAMYRKAVALLPNDRDLPVVLAKTLLAANQIREAETELKHFSQSGRMTALAALYLGQARLDLNDLEGAREAFRTAIDLSPTLKKAHYGLAQVYARLGKPEKARFHMDAFRELAAKDYEMHGERVQRVRSPAALRDLALRIYEESAQRYEKRGNATRAAELRRRAASLSMSHLESGN